MPPTNSPPVTTVSHSAKFVSKLRLTSPAKPTQLLCVSPVIMTSTQLTPSLVATNEFLSPPSTTTTANNSHSSLKMITTPPPRKQKLLPGFSKLLQTLNSLISTTLTTHTPKSTISSLLTLKQTCQSKTVPAPPQMASFRCSLRAKPSPNTNTNTNTTQISTSISQTQNLSLTITITP